MNHESSQCLTSFYHGMTFLSSGQEKLINISNYIFHSLLMEKKFMSKLLKLLFKEAQLPQKFF